MNARLGLILATAALFSGSGCAAGGGGGSESAGPAAVPSLPSGGGQILAEGIRPRDNGHTRSAETFLNEALGTEDGPEKDALYQQALEAALDGITADPENPKSYYQGAIANVNLRDYVAADSMFTRAETLHPRYVLETEPWRERGWVNAYNDAIIPMNEGDMEEAARYFEAANTLYSQRPEALLMLGSVYSRMGQPDRSVEAFETAVAMLEESKELAMLDSTLAEGWAEQWDIASTGLGQAYQITGRFQEAADLYGQLLAEDPDNPALIGSLASALTELNQPDSVDALYDNLLNRPGLTEFDLSNAGVGLYRIEQYERAAQAFRGAADLNPFNRDARLNLTQTYYQAEDWESLIPAAQELLELDPLNGTIWIFMTRAYSELERTEEANEVFGQYQAIGYELEDIMLEGNPDGGARITGFLKNNTAEPGGTVTLRFHFAGLSAREIGTVNIRVQIPAVEESVEFAGDFAASEGISGYRYEVVG